MKKDKITVINLDAKTFKVQDPKGYKKFRKMLSQGNLIALKDDRGEFSGWAIEVPECGYFGGEIISGIGSFNKWLCRPAKWYQFWYPGSGIFGGLFFTALVVTISYLITFIYEAIR